MQSFPFFRRLGAIAYDTLLVLAIFLIATALLLFFTEGKAISSGNLYYQLYLITLWFSFIIWFWTKGGQTAGMAAWRLRLVTLSNEPISTKQALLRLLIAIPSFLIGGLGLFWSLWDENNLTVYDRVSKTKLVLLDKRANKKNVI